MCNFALYVMYVMNVLCISIGIKSISSVCTWLIEYYCICKVEKFSKFHTYIWTEIN